MANTGTVIELSPEQLAQQGQEMLKLKSSYESLFQGMLSDLQGINSGWSELLANNFTGKIASAQKSFYGVTKMLQNGSMAAQMSANNIASQDRVLGELARGGTLQNIPVPPGKSASGSPLMSGAGTILDSMFYSDELGDKERAVTMQAYKKMGSNALSFSKNVGKLTKNLATGKYVDAAFNTWGIINNVYSVANVAAPIEIGLGRFISAVTGDDSYREAALEKAQEAVEIEGYTDALKSENQPEWVREMGKYTEILDQAAEGKKLFDAGKDMVEDAGDMEKVLGSEHLTNETKMSYVKDVVLKNLGFSEMDYSEDTYAGQQKNRQGFFGNIGNLCEWGLAADKGEGDKYFLDKFKLTKFGKDADSFFEDTTEIIYSWMH